MVEMGTQGKFLEILESMRQQLIDEIFAYYKTNRIERGKQAYQRWKEQFEDFLQDYLPEEVIRFQNTPRQLIVTSSSETANNLFLRTKGNPCLEYINELEDSIRKGRIQISTGNKPKRLSYSQTTSDFVDLNRLQELQDIKSTDFDLLKLVRLCEELNICYKNESYLAVTMLVRAVLDHIPPIFTCNSFAEIANNYSGAKSFKEAMQHLESSSRKIADGYLHTKIRKTETLPNKTQVNFSSDLDVLLAEVVRILKKP